MASDKKILLLIGIPASLKSTWAKNFIKKKSNYVRICRDDYRLMLQQSQFMEPKGEKLVTELVYNAIKQSIKKYNVIVDQTNVNLKYLTPFVEFCQTMADVEFKIFDVPVEVAIERDKNRDATVGENVIRKMYKNYLQLFDSNFDFSPRKKKDKEVFLLKQDESLPKAVVVDIDGTLAFKSNRSPYDWKRVGEDLPNRVVIDHCNLYKSQGYKVIILSGRDSICRPETEEWLKRYGIKYDHLYMRSENDNRKDSIIKKEFYNNYILNNYNVFVVLDDRQQVVDEIRGMGLSVFQVNESPD